jgi:hypothetical protein
MTLAVTQSLLVSSGGKTYAIPSSMVKHVRELKGDDAVALRLAGGEDWMDHHYTYHYLPRLLGNADAQPGIGTWLLLVGAGNELMALEVDALRGNQEVVVKPVGAATVAARRHRRCDRAGRRRGDAHHQPGVAGIARRHHGQPPGHRRAGPGAAGIAAAAGHGGG